MASHTNPGKHVPVHGVTTIFRGETGRTSEPLLLRGERRLLVRRHRREPPLVFVQIIAGASGLRRVEQVGVLFRGAFGRGDVSRPRSPGRHRPKARGKAWEARDRTDPFKPFRQIDA